MADQSYGSQMSSDQGMDQKEESSSRSHLEVHTRKPHRLQVKIAIPVKEHPNFNFVGKLLGPKGSSLKQLQEMTQTRMAILGRGSMRDKNKEEELRTKGEVKYAHLNDELHVEVSAYAAPAEAYRRIAHAIDEIARFLVPDYSDDIRQYQLQEMSNGRGQKPPPPYGFEEPAPPSRPPPGGAPPSRGGGTGYWSSAPPTRGGSAPRRVLQPRPAPTGRRMPPPAPAAEYNYEESYNRYEGGAASRSTDYYNDQMEETDASFSTEDYAGKHKQNAYPDQRGSLGSAPRSFNPRARTHPYSAAGRTY